MGDHSNDYSVTAPARLLLAVPDAALAVLVEASAADFEAATAVFLAPRHATNAAVQTTMRATARPKP